MPLRLENPEYPKAVSVRRLNVPDGAEESKKDATKSLSKKGSQKAATTDGQSADTTEEK